MVVPLPKSKPTYRGSLPTSKPAPTARNQTAARIFGDLQKQLSGRGPRTPVFTPPRKGSRPIAKLYRDLTPLEQEARDRQGIESLKGFAVGLPAGLLGLPADLAALIFKDAPQLAAKLVTGQELKVEERTFIDKLVGEFQRKAGAEAIMGYMGFGVDLLPEEDEKGQPVNLATDALSQAGVTPFRAGSLIGEVTVPIPTGAGIARLLGRRSKDAGEVLPPERVEPTISTTSDEPGEIIEGSVVERLEGPRPPDEVMATPEEIAALPPPRDEEFLAELEEIERVAAEELAAAPPEPPTPAANFIQTRDDVIDDGNGVFEFDQTGRLETGTLTDDELIQRYIEARDEFTAGMAARPEGPLDLNDVDNLAQDAADRAGTRMGYIQNELIGRRDGHYVQLTDNELAEIQVQEAVGEMLSRPEEPDAPTSLAVTDTNNNIIPEAEEGFQGLPGGIGSLDESMPIYGNYNLTIGSMPDEFKGSVIHYSPTMTNFQNFVGSRAFARQQDSGKKLEAKQWVAALNKNPGNSQKVGTVGKEIKNSEFENIMLSNPEKKYNQTEIRRLLTSRLPQTRSRLFLESNSNQEFQDGESPFRSLYAVDAQYRSADLNSARDKGLIVFSNTAPTIDVPGFGRLKPTPVHNYYGGSSGYPGYYGHGRFIIVESQDGKRYMQINELQSNSVSDVSSGSHLGGTRYVKTLEDRLQAYRDGYDSVRIPYTPEVHKIMKEVQDLKPEVIETNDVLARSVQENEREIRTIAESYKWRTGRLNRYEPGSEDLSKVRLLGPVSEGLRGRDDLTAVIIQRHGGDRAQEADYKRAVQDRVTDILDERGIPYTAQDVEHMVDKLDDLSRNLNDTYDAGDFPLIHSKIRKEIMGGIGPRDRDPTVEEFNAFLTAKDNGPGMPRGVTKSELFEIMLKSDFKFDVEDNIVDEIAASLLLRDKDVQKIFKDLTPDEIAKLDLNEPYRARRVLYDELVSKIPQETADNVLNRVQEEINNSVSAYAAPDVRDELQILDNSEEVLDDAMLSLLYDIDGTLEEVKLSETMDNLRQTGNELVSKVADIADDVNAAQADWNNTLANLPNAEEVATLMDIGRITGQERRGFIEPLPYNSDEDFYKFATRAAIKEAEKLGLDGVIFPDAAYLSTQPQRRPNDAFLRNYGRVIDSELKELTKADENAGVRLRKIDIITIGNNDPFELIGRGEGFEVRGIDPSDPDVQEALQPFRTEVRNADREYKQAKATVEELRARGAQPDDPFSFADALREETRLKTRLESVKNELNDEVSRRSTTYNSELRVVEFDNDANRQLARRPIRRATGGMVRSGIGAMAREVM